MSWKDCKSSGPWAFTPQENKWGYLNNPLWSAQQDAIDFCEDQDLVLDQSNQHDPCGHWHKAEVTEEPFPAGRWVAAMQQPGTPYIYVYDILQKAVIRIDTSEIPVFVSSRLELDSAYALDYDMGRGSPGAQRGAYCMNKDATRIWYLFCDQGAYPITRDHPDAQLIEVDISKTVMRVVKRTLFPNLLPSTEPFPAIYNWGRVNDGCSDDTYTYWCTDLIAGRIIKIRNSDHSIIDDHTFNYTIEACGSGSLDEAIVTIDVNKSTGKLFWVYCRDHIGCSPPYNACRHLIRANTDLVADIDSVACASGSLSPAWQNMIRIYSNYIFHHRAYYPTTIGYLMKRNLGFSPSGDQVRGTDDQIYSCILNHTSDAAKRPITGGNWSTYWVLDGATGGMWSAGINYSAGYLTQEYLQNIFGVKNDKVFTLMHVNSQEHPAFLYCIDFSDMDEISKLDVSYYTGQIFPPGGYDWDWTSVSAMNYQTGVIAIFRYNNVESRNYVGCFNADSDLGFLCDVPLYSVKYSSDQGVTDEPQVWVMPGDDAPEPADPSPAPISPGPGGAPCTGQSPELSQDPISVSVTEGSDAANRNIRVTDNCNVSLAFQVEEVNNNNHIAWISSPAAGNTGNGALNVNFNTISMSAGNYSGSIVISTSLGSLTLNIDLVVTSSSGHGEASGTTLIKGDMYRRFDFRAGEVKLFKFRANSGPVSPTLTVVAEVMSHYGNQNGKLHLMARYAGQNWETAPPNDNDYADIQTYIGGDWTKRQGIYNGIYYFMTKTLVKRMCINLSPQVTDGCFYFWIKNYGGINLADCMVHFQVRE
jgi:hypothetical protein